MRAVEFLCSFSLYPRSTGECEGKKHMAMSKVDGTDLVLTREQETLLESIFWLVLGCALGWQDKECYEGANPEALLEAVTSHV
jgi:hypothetical protein